MVRLHNGRKPTFHYKDVLRENGFSYIEKGRFTRYWEKESLGEGEVKRWRMYARKAGLFFECHDSRYERNSTYRSDFFRAYPPFYKDRYFCVYCGRLLNPQRLEVDHIISVHAAADTMAGKRMLKRRKIEDVNDVRNLAASCRRCNRKKGSRLYGWVFRGYLGKSNKYQVVRWAVRLILASIVIIFVFLYGKIL